MIPCRPLQRMCAGMLLAACSFVMAAFIQIAIQVSYSSRKLRNLQVSSEFRLAFANRPLSYSRYWTGTSLQPR